MAADIVNRNALIYEMLDNLRFQFKTAMVVSDPDCGFFGHMICPSAFLRSIARKLVNLGRTATQNISPIS
jgi:hypothetical protein